MSIYPVTLKKSETPPARLWITWSDGLRQEFDLRRVLDLCPCATCNEKRKAPPAEQPGTLPLLEPGEAQPLQLVGMQPVGNYAYSLQFNSGCSRGIYTFEHLRALGSPAAELPQSE